MTEELLPWPVTAESIANALQSAFLDAECGPDEEVVVLGPPKMVVTHSPKDIQLMAIFDSPVHATRLQRLEFVNRVNDELRVPRASIHTKGKNEALVFDWCLPAATPVSKRALVESVRRFQASFSAVASRDVEDILD